jgi:hypothetical protein
MSPRSNGIGLAIFMRNARPFIDGGRHIRVSGSLYQEKARSQTAKNQLTSRV